MAGTWDDHGDRLWSVDLQRWRSRHSVRRHELSDLKPSCRQSNAVSAV